MEDFGFLDLIVLKKVREGGEDATVEKFGGQINTSFFETANLLGTLKVKKLLELEPSVGGASRVAVSESGHALLEMAGKRELEKLDALDHALLRAMSSGVRDLDALERAVNVRSGDLAFHLDKMCVQGLCDYTVRSAKVTLALTERGFNKAGAAGHADKSGESAAAGSGTEAGLAGTHGLGAGTGGGDAAHLAGTSETPGRAFDAKTHPVPVGGPGAKKGLLQSGVDWLLADKPVRAEVKPGESVPEDLRHEKKAELHSSGLLNVPEKFDLGKSEPGKKPEDAFLPKSGGQQKLGPERESAPARPLTAEDIKQRRWQSKLEHYTEKYAMLFVLLGLLAIVVGLLALAKYVLKWF